MFGLTEIFHPPKEATVDVVFVHGIFGHPKGTFTCDETNTFWPSDLLPPILEDEGTRILTYGYKSDADVFTDRRSKCMLDGVVANLGRDLASNRQVSLLLHRGLSTPGLTSAQDTKSV